jgi:hypothetical protein
LCIVQFRYFLRGKKILILISFHYPIFSARHTNLFSKCQNFRVTRCAILIYSVFSIFSFDIFSPKQLKILELNCKTIRYLKYRFWNFCFIHWHYVRVFDLMWNRSFLKKHTRFCMIFKTFVSQLNNKFYMRLLVS